MLNCPTKIVELSISPSSSLRLFSYICVSYTTRAVVDCDLLLANSLFGSNPLYPNDDLISCLFCPIVKATAAFFYFMDFISSFDFQPSCVLLTL